MKRIFILEADVITQRDFELIHRYILSRLNATNKHLIIKSIPLNKKNERLIFHRIVGK